MNNIRNQVGIIAKYPIFQIYWRDLRTNPRYARFGILSALMTVCIMVIYRSPLPELPVDTLVWLYTHPVMDALHTVAFVGGFSLTIAMGIIAAIRSGRQQRVMGIVSVLISANYLCEFRTGLPLWEALLWDVQFGVELAVGIPVSLAYDLAGQNPVLALLMLLLVPVLFWIPLRGRVLRSVEDSRAGQILIK